MAIDVSTFILDVPSGTTFTKGEEIDFIIKDGPAVVRSGFGEAKLKRVLAWKSGSGGIGSYAKVQNSDWIDPLYNDTPVLNATALDRRTPAYQSGDSCPLTPNSSWSVKLVPAWSGTTSADTTYFVTIEVDYPSVSAVVDPDNLIGIPATLQQDFTLTSNANGAGATAKWDVINTDMFKAGYAYALQKASIAGYSANGVVGLLSISNAAGMRGLTRTIPVCGDASAIGMIIEYASTLVKGPMDLRLMLFETTATSRTITVSMDFVKRRI